ncbi:MAG: ABC transporter permease, partial [Betaproteobacteria bacterium]|nr:ABC transporter permease [Candidatus Fonsibacter lacus]
ISAMLATEGMRVAQAKYGKGKVITGEQMRWGLENMNLTDIGLRSLGFGGVMRTTSTNCSDHMGAAWVRVHTWNGKVWEFTSDWLEGDRKVLDPMVKSTADKYGAEKGIKRRAASDCNA